MLRTLLLAALPLAAQTETFGIFTFTPPAGWQRQSSATSLSFARLRGNTFCQLGLFLPASSPADPLANFQTDYQTLVLPKYKTASAPRPERGAESNGWTAVSATIPVSAPGSGNFNAELRTYTGHGQRATILLNTNFDGCPAELEGFHRSLRLTAPATTAATAATPAPNGPAEILPDAVRLSRPGVTVLIYYAIPITDAHRQGDLPSNFWRQLLRTTPAKVTLSPPFSGEPHYVEGLAESGFAALTIHVENGTAFPVVALARNERPFRDAFPTPKSLDDMRAQNYFPVTPAELAGRWTSSTSAAAETYNVSTGLYTGLMVAANSRQLTFSASGDYVSETQAVTGKIGNLRTHQEKQTGRWQSAGFELRLQPVPAGEEEVLHCGFIAVRGGKALRLVNKRYSGMRWDLYRAK